VSSAWAPWRHLLEPALWAPLFLVAGDTPLSAFGIPISAPYSTAACLLAICAAGVALQPRQQLWMTLRRGRGLLLVAILLGVALAASLAYTTAPRYGLEKTVAYWGFGVIVLVLGLIGGRGDGSVHRLLIGFSLLGLILGTLGIAELVFEGGGRQLAVLGSGPNVYVRVLFLGVFSAATLASLAMSRWALCCWALIAAVPLVPMLFTGSRGGLIAALAALSTTAVFGLWKRGAGRLACASGCLFAAIIVIGFVLPAAFPGVFGVMDRYQHLAAEMPGGSSVQVRLEAARIGLRAFLDHPICGVGVGGFSTLHGLRYPHNLVVEVLSELGLVGGLLLLCAGTLTVRGLWRGVRRCRGESYALLGWGGGVLIFTLAAAQFSGDLGDSRYVLFAAALVLGLAAQCTTAVRRRRRSDEPPGMRVWILNHYAQPPTLPGGTRHFELARGLSARGFDVTIVASAFHHPTRSLAVRVDGAFRVETVEGVRFVWLKSAHGYRGNDLSRVGNMVGYAWRAWWHGRRSFRHRVPPPDVVVGSSPHLLSPLVAWLLARRFAAPFVLEIRDLWPETMVALGIFGRRHPVVVLLGAVERFLYRRAGRIISLLPEAWRHVVRAASVPASRIAWIPNGVTVAAEPPSSPPRPAAGRTATVMYVGAHGRANVLGLLLEAEAILEARGARARLVLVGDGPEKPGLIDRAHRMHLRRVVFRDAVPKEEVPRTLAAADILVALVEDSSLYSYGISLNKLFDYMAAAKPIAFAGRVAHDYVKLAGCGRTVPPGSASALAIALGELVEMSPKRRDELGRRGREYVATHHDWGLLSGRLEAVLREATGD